ncbi:MAG: hypothetical protein WBA57_24325 [Elainellaceae cyanobacterium]
MARGLMWLPLLAVFIGLAWAGWSEYQKLESYKVWAQSFDQSKYDIYAVLGLTGNVLVWGKPTRRGPIELQQCWLMDIDDIQVIGDGQAVDWSNLPERVKHINLHLHMKNDSTFAIPFTEMELAVRWARFIQAQGNAIASAEVRDPRLEESQEEPQEHSQEPSQEEPSQEQPQEQPQTEEE